MKKSVISALVSIAVLVPSLVLAVDLNIGGLQKLATDKLKEAKPVGMISPSGQLGGGLFLPIHTFHAKYKDGKPDVMLDYVEIGLGYKAQEGHRPGGFLAADLNLVGLTRRLLNNQWSRDHVKSSKFPPIFIGPAFVVPLDLHQIKGMRWDNLANHIEFIFSVRVGK